MSGGKRPAYVLAMERIGESNLDAGCKNVLRAMLEWADLRPSGGLLWPRVSLLARHMGLTIRGVQRIIARLVKAKVLSIESPGGGVTSTGRGRTTVYRIHFGAMIASGEDLQTPTVGQGSDVRGGAEPRPASQKAPNGATSNPDPRSEEPSIHQPASETTTIRAREQPAAGWMDGAMTGVASALREKGIRGKNLERLAAVPGLTVSEVESEWESIRKANGVRNPSAVLATRLTERHLPNSSKRGTLGADAISSIARIEARRRAPRSG